MTVVARWRGTDYEVVNFTEGAEWVLRDAAGDLQVVDHDTGDPVRVKCERCGRLTSRAAPIGGTGRWVCHDTECYDLEVASGSHPGDSPHG